MLIFYGYEISKKESILSSSLHTFLNFEENILFLPTVVSVVVAEKN